MKETAAVKAKKRSRVKNELNKNELTSTPVHIVVEDDRTGMEPEAVKKAVLDNLFTVPED